MITREVHKNSSSKVVVTIGRTLIPGWSEMGTPDQYVFHRFESVNCERKTVV